MEFEDDIIKLYLEGCTVGYLAREFMLPPKVIEKIITGDLEEFIKEREEEEDRKKYLESNEWLEDEEINLLNLEDNVLNSGNVITQNHKLADRLLLVNEFRLNGDYESLSKLMKLDMQLHMEDMKMLKKNKKK